MRPMKILRIISSPLLFTILFASCEQNEPAVPNDIVPGPVVGMASYPLNVGNEWRYKMTVDIDGAATSNEEFTVDFKIVADTVINGTAVKKVRSTETQGQVAGNDRLGYRFLTHSDFGLDNVAVQGPSTQVFMRLNEELSIPNYSMVAFTQQTSSTEVIVLDSALHYMKFPAIDGDVWRSNEFGATSGAEFKRKWSGYFTVTTGAGSFDCLRMDLFGDSDQNNLPDSNSIFIQQYISPEYGLIKEIDIRELNWGEGETAQYQRELTLTTVNIQ